MITIENGIYVVNLPEHGIRQDFDPTTGHAFASQAAAQDYENAVLAGIAEQQQAHAAAEQARLAAEIVINVNLAASKIAVGAPLTFTATLKNGLGQTLPITDSFGVPIQDEAGATVKIKAVSFTNGAASGSITFDRSGYYRITAQGINRRLPPEQQMRLDSPVEVAVFE